MLRHLVALLMLVVSVGLLAPGCQSNPFGCGLLNTTACTDGPMPMAFCSPAAWPTNGQLVACNLVVADLSPTVQAASVAWWGLLGRKPAACGFLQCEQPGTNAVAVARAGAVMLLGYDPGDALQCLLRKGTIAEAGSFQFGTCLTPKAQEAPCSMFGEECEYEEGPQCCQPPVAPFKLICGQGADDQNDNVPSVCCVGEGAPCQPLLPNNGCCPANSNGAANECGVGGVNADANHDGVCCAPDGAECFPESDGPDDDGGDICCSGSCVSALGGPYPYVCDTY